MAAIDITIETPVSQSVRAAQVSSMFDVPAAERATMSWHGDLPIEERDWNVGLIVGPSGSGKSTILNRTFGTPAEFDWPGESVVDDIAPGRSVEDIAAICQAVGFNTIPAWLRPYSVLSNGEKFRVDLARRLIEGGSTVACDEFTSVVDRQIARIGAHAVQKHIRRQGRRFVAASCHYDLEEWLQPDWVLEPATMSFRWRSVQRRPDIRCQIAYVPIALWQTFARFHYLTAELNPGARCFCLYVEGEPAAFTAAIHRVHAQSHMIMGLARGVVLPDYQGLGLIFALIDRVAAAYKTRGLRTRSYPAHPGYIRSHDRSPVWNLITKPGLRGSNRGSGTSTTSRFGGRPSAVYEYCGPPLTGDEAALLLDGAEYGGFRGGVR